MSAKNGKDFWLGFDIETENVYDYLDDINPDVIVNLAGQNNVDIVENNPSKYFNINVNFPLDLAKWSDRNNKHFIQVSTQGVFSGKNAPYTKVSIPDPITQYGKQKALSEEQVLLFDNTQVVRLTFVLGLRPFKNIGRQNPLESMLETPEQFQVNDRFFSPVFAEDAAKILWERVMKNASHYDRIIHVGNPIRCSRYTIAQDLIEISNGELDIKIHPVSHNYFSSDTKRPEDTTWKENHSLYKTEYLEGLRKYYLQWKKRTSWI